MQVHRHSSTRVTEAELEKVTIKWFGGRCKGHLYSVNFEYTIIDCFSTNDFQT